MAGRKWGRSRRRLGEVYQFVLRGKGHTLMELETLLDWTLMPQMRMVPGVVELNSFGGEDKQYEVLLDPRKLASAGLGLSDVLEALSRSNANAGGGYIEQGEREGSAHPLAGSHLQSGRRPQRGGRGDLERRPITVGALGTVDFAPRMRRGAATMNGEGEVVVGVALMLLGENSRLVTENVKARLEEVKKTLPEGVSMSLITTAASWSIGPS